MKRHIYTPHNIHMESGYSGPVVIQKKEPNRKEKIKRRNMWIQWLQGVSACVHFVMMIISIYIKFGYENKMNKDASQYTYYKPEIVGDNSTALSSTIKNLNAAYTQRCNRAQGSSGSIMALEATFPINNRDTHVRLSWIPMRFRLMGHDNVDGYVLLILIFLFSSLFEGMSCYWVWKSQEDDNNQPKYTELPCMWRWMEYAVTSPIMILLIASALMIRDIYTLYMLVFAQVALVQLGFGVEYAIYAKVASPNRHLRIRDMGAIDYVNVPTVSLPIDYNNKQEREYCLVDRLFWFSFSPSWLLHGAIWAVLIQSFTVQENLDCENSSGDNWKGILLAVIVTQCLGFSSFAIVSFFQGWMVGIINLDLVSPRITFLTIPLNGHVYLFGIRELTFFKQDWIFPPPHELTEELTRDVLSWGFLLYSFLSLIVKVLLGATYISFVVFFPFSTAHII